MFRRLLLFCLSLMAAAPAVAANPFTLHAVLDAQGGSSSAPLSWREGGFGRLDEPRGHDWFRDAQMRLGVDFDPSSWFHLRLHGAARGSNDGGRQSGLVEGFAELHHSFASDSLSLRGGQFFVPSSRENRDELWTSPYTLTLSAWNSWMAQEVRPTGIDLQWRHEFSQRLSGSVGGMLFRGNDAAGAGVAWRGFTMGERLSLRNEVLPLPSLYSLHDPRIFGGQRSDGTLPIGGDLDGRDGFSARVKLQLESQASLVATHYDNRGDRRLHRGQYAWDTRFDVVGFDASNSSGFTFAAESARGRTAMGLRAQARVDAPFETTYLLVSQRRGAVRGTLRFDTFQVGDRDHSSGEDNREHGTAWTSALLFDVRPHLTVGAEYLQLRGKRPAAVQSGAIAEQGGNKATLVARLSF